MRILLPLVMLLALVAPAESLTVWDVEYGLRGDVSQASRFFDDGAYGFILTADYISVYTLETNWIFLGHYGSAVLPATMPEIRFPAGTDFATAVSRESAAATVPEPDTLPMMVTGLVTIYLLAFVYVFRRRLT